MRFFEYDYKNYNGEDKHLKLRLVSGDMKAIEKATGTTLFEYVSNASITMLTTMLYYMNRPNIPSFSMRNAEDLYDELVDSGLVLENIYLDIIMEALVVSGFMKKEDLEEIKGKKEEDNIAIKAETPRKNK